jgi:hypothetical protein
MQQVESALRAWWDHHASSALTRRRSAEECRRLGGTVFDIQPEVSSVQAVPVVLQVEPLLGFELSRNVIRRGGYNGRQQFVQDLTARIESEHAKHHGLAGAIAPALEEEVSEHV